MATFQRLRPPELLVSVSSDGNVLQWSLKKGGRSAGCCATCLVAVPCARPGADVANAFEEDPQPPSGPYAQRFQCREDAQCFTLNVKLPKAPLVPPAMWGLGANCVYKHKEGIVSRKSSGFCSWLRSKSFRTWNLNRRLNISQDATNILVI